MEYGKGHGILLGMIWVLEIMNDGVYFWGGGCHIESLLQAYLSIRSKTDIRSEMGRIDPPGYLLPATKI